MNTIFRATAALALLAATLPALAASATVTRAWQFKPESNAGLTVRNLMGNVRVERGTAPGIHITANTTIEAATPGGGGPADRADRFPHLGRRRGLALRRAAAARAFPEDLLGEGRLELVLDRATSSTSASASGWSATRTTAPAVRVDLVIRAPAGAKLDVSNTFGDAVAQGYSGKLRLDGGSGLLTSTGGEGEVELDNGSGEVSRQRPSRARRRGHRQRRR